MIRKFTFATALLLLTATANAAEMPEQLGFHAGETWCTDKHETRGGWTVTSMSSSGEDCKDPSDFAIEANGSFGWEDTSCTPIHVGEMQVKAPRGRTLEWTITARCTYYGGRRDYTKTEVFKCAYS
jgi:hypothetical protein